MSTFDPFRNPDAGDFYIAPSHEHDSDTIRRLSERGRDSNSGALARRIQYLEGAVEALTTEIRQLKEEL